MVSVQEVGPSNPTSPSTAGLSNEVIAKGIKFAVQERILAINTIAESKDPKAYSTSISCVFDGVSSDVRIAGLRGLKTLRESGIEPPSGMDIIKVLKLVRSEVVDEHSKVTREADNVYGYWLKKNTELGIANVFETKPKQPTPCEVAEIKRKATQSKRPESEDVQWIQ